MFREHVQLFEFTARLLYNQSRTNALIVSNIVPQLYNPYTMYSTIRPFGLRMRRNQVAIRGYPEDSTTHQGAFQQFIFVFSLLYATRN